MAPRKAVMREVNEDEQGGIDTLFGWFKRPLSVYGEDRRFKTYLFPFALEAVPRVL